MTTFTPELGQQIHGQPFKQYATSDLVDSALYYIRDRLDNVMWNINQREYDSPFANTGNDFKCDLFEVHAYSWSDEPQPFNFKWRDVEISWYKYLGRGMSANMEIPPALTDEMLTECLKALERYETQHGKD